ncbi:hypothetical protein ABH926_002617 [Catenulispora sp. GP43]|uniref:hypothetical protein n=1 Tax=Catenulispora sp. GP43 TaxID=3156263 RepID=UPI0035110C99
MELSSKQEWAHNANAARYHADRADGIADDADVLPAALTRGPGTSWFLVERHPDGVAATSVVG